LEAVDRGRVVSDRDQGKETCGPSTLVWNSGLKRENGVLELHPEKRGGGGFVGGGGGGVGFGGVLWGGGGGGGGWGVGGVGVGFWDSSAEKTTKDDVYLVSFASPTGERGDELAWVCE